MSSDPGGVPRAHLPPEVFARFAAKGVDGMVAAVVCKRRPEGIHLHDRHPEWSIHDGHGTWLGGVRLVEPAPSGVRAQNCMWNPDGSVRVSAVIPEGEHGPHLLDGAGVERARIVIEGGWSIVVADRPVAQLVFAGDHTAEVLDGFGPAAVLERVHVPHERRLLRHEGYAPEWVLHHLRWLGEDTSWTLLGLAVAMDPFIVDALHHHRSR